MTALELLKTFRLLRQLVNKHGYPKTVASLRRYKAFRNISTADVRGWYTEKVPPSELQITEMERVLPKIKASLAAAAEREFQSLPAPENG